MTLDTHVELICPKRIADPETGEVYFEKGERVTQEALEAALANAHMLKNRSGKLSAAYNDLKAVFSEYWSHYGDVIDAETGKAFTMTSGGDAKYIDLRQLAMDSPQTVLEMAEQEMLVVKGCEYKEKRIEDALNLPKVHNYYHKEPRTQRANFYITEDI